MKTASFRLIITIAVGLLLILAITAVGLRSDSGRVSGQALREAEKALAGYLAAYPEMKPRSLVVVDFSQPSYVKRMMILDLQNGKRSYYLVAHGRNSGELYARHFSNVPDSNTSSLGLFHITRRYTGDHGLALRLDGLDPLRNSNAAVRDIVLHSAGYVSISYMLLNFLTGYGPMIGRSNGCFAISRCDIDEVTEKLTGGGFLYAWTGELQ
jgi:hypothetical protein